MASIVLASVGSAFGNALLPGIGGQILGGMGRQFGKQLDSDIGLGTTKNGPQLTNLSVHDSRYGKGIPTVFGCARVAGNVIWASDLIETSQETQTGGGKGGVVTGVVGGTRTTYSYSIHCAIAITSGEIGGIATIWADTKVIYQNGVWLTGVVGSSTFYNGTMTQNVDPFLQSMIGSGQVPAYRGVAYVVLESLQLGNFGNRLPSLTFEIMPLAITSAPQWLGSVDAGIDCMPVVVCNKGMDPIVIEGGSVSARRLIVGGFVNPGATTAFSVVEYDVTGDTPTELARLLSASFAVSDVGNHSWALDPSGRYVALCLQNVGSSPTYQLAIYDTESRQFGSVFPINLILNNDTKQIAWIDAQHFVITDISGNQRGLHIFARAGLGIIDLGFYNVWGANSTTSKQPLYYTQFTPTVGGLLHYMVDYSPNFTVVYVCPVFWQGNTLAAGASYTLVSGISTGTGSGAQAAMLRTGDDEWTLFYGTVVDMQLMSFQPGLSSAVITRPWQRLTNTSFSVTTSNHPVVFGDRIVVVQRSNSDNNYRLSEISLDGGSFSLAVDGAIVNGFGNPEFNFGAMAIDGARLLLMGLGGFNNDLAQLAIIQRRNTGDTLDNIVAALLTNAGYASSDYDVTALADVPIDGFVLANPMAAAAALTPLQVFEPFDLVESDTQLKAVKRGQAAAVAIPDSESCATDKLTPEPLPSREQTRLQELDLPVEVTIDYLDASRDYEIGSQRARRSATRGARTMAKVNLPIVCTAERAKQIAEERLFTAWAERDHARVRWSRRWLAVGPGDVVDLGDRLMRVMQVKQTGGLLDVQGTLVASSSITSAAQADGGVPADHAGILPVASTLYLMDLPLLRAADDQPGVYAAVSGIAGWPGASLWRAADGVNYSDMAAFSTAATAGIATTALPNCPSWFMDCASTVNVQMLQGILASCGAADLLNGANAAMLGSEIIQFQTATLIGPGLYALSNLLRGRRGTESTTGTHVVGEQFVLLTQGSVQFIPALLTDRNRNYEFRALSNGQALCDAVDTNFTYALMTLQPFSPVYVAGSRSSGTGSDLTITWIRCARKNGDWIDYVDVPLDEPVELYDVEIMNGSVVMRTFSSVPTALQVYSAAQQTADWGGSIPAHYTVNVYQISSRYGRGQKATAVV
jgi:hypothetical protein